MFSSNHMIKSINIQNNVCFFFTHLVSLSGDEPLWKEPAGFCTVRTSVSCVADSEYRLFSLFAFHHVNCHWMGGWGKPLLLYMNMCTVCVLACHSLLLINLSNCNRTINICFYKYTGCSVSVYDFTALEIPNEIQSVSRPTVCLRCSSVSFAWWTTSYSAVPVSPNRGRHPKWNAWSWSCSIV